MMALASDNALGDILKTPPNGAVWIFISNLMAPSSGWFDLNRIEPRSANMGPNGILASFKANASVSVRTLPNYMVYSINPGIQFDQPGCVAR